MEVGVTFWERTTVCGEAGVESSKVTESRLRYLLSPPPAVQLLAPLTSQALLMLPTQVLSAPVPVIFSTIVSSPAGATLSWKASEKESRVPVGVLSVGVLACV